MPPASNVPRLRSGSVGETGMLATRCPRRDSGLAAFGGGIAATGAASGSSGATKVPLPVRARTYPSDASRS